MDPSVAVPEMSQRKRPYPSKLRTMAACTIEMPVKAHTHFEDIIFDLFSVSCDV